MLEFDPDEETERPARSPAPRYGDVRLMGTTVGFQALHAFRADLYGCFRRADPRFDLVDALITGEAVASLPNRTLRAAHRKG